MDTVTELTCPECGEQQTSAEECASCGASLLSPAEDIQDIQSEKTVSSPWPTTTPSKTDAPIKPSEPEVVQQEATKEEVVADLPADPRSEPEVFEETKDRNPPSTDEWKPTRIDDENDSITAQSETPRAQENVLPEHAHPVIDEVVSEEPQSTTDLSDLTDTVQQIDNDTSYPLSTPTRNFRLLKSN